MLTPPPLTPAQLRVLTVIRRWHQQHGYMPSIEEIAGRLRLSSFATVHKHLTTLQEKGYIRRGFGRARSITLLDPEHRVTCPACGTAFSPDPREAA